MALQHALAQPRDRAGDGRQRGLPRRPEPAPPRDAETGEVLWETILGSQITGYPVTYRAGGRQYLAVPVGGAGNQLAAYATELEAPIGSNMIVVFALP